MGRIAGRLFSQQPFAWNCEKYANNRRRSAKMRMNILLTVREECLRIKKSRLWGLDFVLLLIDYRAGDDSVFRI